MFKQWLEAKARLTKKEKDKILAVEKRKSEKEAGEMMGATMKGINQKHKKDAADEKRTPWQVKMQNALKRST